MNGELAAWSVLRAADSVNGGQTPLFAGRDTALVSSRQLLLALLPGKG
jgi:hypothetical protein